MKIFTKNALKKSVAGLIALSFIFTSAFVFPVYASASDNGANAVIAEHGSARSRHIFASGSTGDYVSGDYTFGKFTTPSHTQSLEFGMSYYLDSKSAKTEYNLVIYKSNGAYFQTQALTKNYSGASTVLNLANNTSYYFVIDSGDDSTQYSFSYNLYYNN